MAKRKTIFTVLWVIIAVIVVASIVSLVIFPRWKAIFFAGSGGFLVLNLFLSMFFIHRNFKE